MKSRGGDISDAFTRGMRRAGVPELRREERTVAGSAFQREADDIVITRVVDGKARTKEQALDVARRRDPGATYKAVTARMYVFRRGR